MAYWRMQLHPNKGEKSVAYASASLTRGLIGLDFHSDVGDLRGDHREIDPRQNDYLRFESEMKVGDHVLVIAHHVPLALTEVAGDYAYVPNANEAFGVWFRHLRFVRNVRFYADFVTNPKQWEQIKMTDTISQLRSTDGLSHKQIDRWLGND